MWHGYFNTTFQRGKDSALRISVPRDFNVRKQHRKVHRKFNLAPRFVDVLVFLN